MFQSKSRMNWIHFMIGLTFYPIVWAFLFASKQVVIQDQVTLLIAISSFNLLQFFQFQCHLAMSRNKNKAKLPDYWMFQYVVCPNFAIECFLYIVLASFYQSITAFLMCIFVFINQIMSALDRKSCYSKPSFAIFYLII